MKNRMLTAVNFVKENPYTTVTFIALVAIAVVQERRNSSDEITPENA